MGWRKKPVDFFGIEEDNGFMAVTEAEMDWLGVQIQTTRELAGMKTGGSGSELEEAKKWVAQVVRKGKLPIHEIVPGAIRMFEEVNRQLFLK